MSRQPNSLDSTNPITGRRHLNINAALSGGRYDVKVVIMLLIHAARETAPFNGRLQSPRNLIRPRWGLVPFNNGPL